MIDGIITDDSDVWLFGAKTVYKNFFVQKKNVMEFRIENVQEMFHLDRNKLVQMAMLVGSDYTLGLTGVGAVTALEILAAFPDTPEVEGETDQYQSMLSSLRKFRDWLKNGRDAAAGKTALKSKLKNVEIIEGFPSREVAAAYLEPNIDTSMDPFSWGMPDQESIVEYARTKLGWTRLKTEEMLLPVLKRLNEKKQTTIRDYFKSQMAKKVFENQKMSKRVQKAVGKIGGVVDEEEQEDSSEKKKPRKRKTVSKATKQKQQAEEEERERKAIEELVMTLSDDDDDDDNDMKPPVAKKSSPSQNNVNAFHLLKQPEPAKSTKKSSAISTRKRKAKKDDPQPSTSKAVAADDVLPPKRAPRIPDTKQVIPQRERDKEEQERNKQKAIEIFKTSKTSAKRK
jgi:DNA excision repair protein ERCC-5